MNQADGAVTAVSSQNFTMSLLHAAQAVTDRLEASLESVGLSMAKHSALTKLSEAAEPLTLSDLAARLSCVRSNITQLVDRLEAEGLVRRVDDASDRRSVRAELTDLGKEKQVAGAAELAKAQEKLASMLNPEDIDGLSVALSALS